MATADLRLIAHRGLALRPSPMLRHQKNGRFALREGVALTDWGLPAPSFKKAAVLGPAPPLGRVRELAAEFFGSSDYGVMVEADAGHPVEAELRAAGWSVAEDEPALVLPALPELPAPPPGLTIRPVTDTASRGDALAVMAAGFGAPTADLGEPLSAEAMDGFGPSLACALDPDVAVLVGYAGGRPVSAALLHRIDEVAVIAGVATVPDCRRRGFARALTWAAIRAGADRGCACATLGALGASYSLYLGMGFRRVCNHRTYVPPS
jgi:ribosomal protein S18 acetylase RimI-like enzyme